MYLTLLQEANLDGSHLMRMDENKTDSSQQKTHWKTIKTMERHKVVQGCGYQGMIVEHTEEGMKDL